MNAINKKLKKIAAARAAENALILVDGTLIDCRGMMHDNTCREAGTTLCDALRAGVCRTHFCAKSETFAIECGRILTDEQVAAARAILRTVNAYTLLTDINGVYNVKQRFSRPIRSIKDV